MKRTSTGRIIIKEDAKNNDILPTQNQKHIGKKNTKDFPKFRKNGFLICDECMRCNPVYEKIKNDFYKSRECDTRTRTRSSVSVPYPIPELGISNIKTTLVRAPFLYGSDETKYLLANYDQDLSWTSDWNRISANMDEFVGFCTRIAFQTIDKSMDVIDDQLVILPIMMQYSIHNANRGKHTDPCLNSKFKPKPFVCGVFTVNITGNATLKLHHGTSENEYVLKSDCAYVLRDMTNPTTMHHSITTNSERHVCIIRFAAFTKKYICDHSSIFDKDKLLSFIKKINQVIPFNRCSRDK